MLLNKWGNVVFSKIFIDVVEFLSLEAKFNRSNFVFFQLKKVLLNHQLLTRLDRVCHVFVRTDGIFT